MNFNWALLGLLNPFEEGSKKQRIVLIVVLVGVLGAAVGCLPIPDLARPLALPRRSTASR